MEPSEQEVRAMFEALNLADRTLYCRLNLNDVLLGYSIAKGLTAPQAIKLIRENPVQEDDRL
jgi:hypothetical protein